jgi:hypothetical protein
VTAERPSRSLNNRELLDRTIIRIRRDLTRAEQLTEIVGINQPPPPEVGQALQVLSDYTIELLAAGRPQRPTAERQPPASGTPDASSVRREPEPPRRPNVEPGPLAARPRPRQPLRRTPR